MVARGLWRGLSDALCCCYEDAARTEKAWRCLELYLLAETCHLLPSSAIMLPASPSRLSI